MNSLSLSLGRKIVYADRRNEECVDRDISLVTYNILADFYFQPATTKEIIKDALRNTLHAIKTKTVFDTNYFSRR